MADYKGGEIFIDLGGLNVEITSTTNTNTVVVSGIYSRLETAHKLGKRIVITNYTSKYGNHPQQQGVPTSVTVYRPTPSSTYFIPVLSYVGISIVAITASDTVTVYKLYSYHNIYTPPETTNNARILEETETEETEKGEESK